MSQNVKGTFASGKSSNAGSQFSDVLVIPTGVTSMRLNIAGAIDASNTVKTQKSTNGLTWSDQTTYNSAQTNTSVSVAHGEQWRLALVASEALKSINYSLSAES